MKLMKLFCAPLFAGAWVALYYGTFMLLLAPGNPGESYFAAKRMLYGIPSTLSSIALLLATAWLWTRSGSAISLRKAIANSFSWAVGTLILFWIVVLIIASVRQG